MQKKIAYTISSFKESEGYSMSKINNVMDSSNETSWKTTSSYAMLDIGFEPVRDFEIKICINYLGILAPLILKVTNEFGINIEKQYNFNQKTKVITVASKKFKMQPEFEFTQLKFEFTKIDDYIQVKYLLLFSQKPQLLKEKSSESKIKQKALKQSLLEKAKSSNCTQKNASDTKKPANLPLKPSPNQLEDCLNMQQQERLKSIIYNENQVQGVKYNTRSSSREMKLDQSFSGLFKDFVVFANVENCEVKKVVVEILETTGAVYIENFTDFCTLVVSESVVGGWDAQEVSVKWLFECVAHREILNFDFFK